MSYSIGDLAKRTGLTVKTIRFYSDRGLLPPTSRTTAGYRQYDGAAVARLELIRTLRDLGLDLATIERVLAREVSVAEVAAAHVAALDAQVRTLRLRRSVLASVVRRGADVDEVAAMHRFVALSEAERVAVVDEFLAAVFESAGESFAAARRTMRPELPDDPTTEQVEAWIELLDLLADDDFRALLRRLVEHHTAEQPGLRPDVVARIQQQITPALALGVAPDSGEAASYLAALGDLPIDHLELAADARRERYFELLAILNGWPPPQSLAPALHWTLTALASSRPGEYRAG
ncbi:MerR family transcriptional regulator [Kribbella amoyensis]|nr:MerR family transcriptional regulator [Kribbella amoyensis]